jgi:hypothetical protein
MMFWFKQDSRNSQALFASSNLGNDKVNTERSYKNFWKTIDSFSVEVRGLSQIYRMRERTNTRSGRLGITETNGRQYDRYRWA